MYMLPDTLSGQTCAQQATQTVWTPCFARLWTGGTIFWWRNLVSLASSTESGTCGANSTAYPGLLSPALSLGYRPIGVPMDSYGVDALALDEIMSNWNEDEMGGVRPKLIVIVPCVLAGTISDSSIDYTEHARTRPV